MSLARRSHVATKVRAWFKTGLHFDNRKHSGTLRGEVLALFVFIQSGPIDVSAEVGYFYS